MVERSPRRSVPGVRRFVLGRSSSGHRAVVTEVELDKPRARRRRPVSIVVGAAVLVAAPVWAVSILGRLFGPVVAVVTPARVAVPSDDAPPAEVVRAYLQALAVHDRETPGALRVDHDAAWQMESIRSLADIKGGRTIDGGSMDDRPGSVYVTADWTMGHYVSPSPGSPTARTCGATTW